MVNRVRVKICGIASLDEARCAIDLGADALGFNFWPKNPRFIAPERAAEIIAALHPFTTSVGVFVDETLDRIKEIVSTAGINAVQLHGDESPEFCRGLQGVKLIKALRVTGDFDAACAAKYPVNAILLDSSVRGMYGGTGERFDWRIAVEAKRYAPIILAGGITIDNVKDAIAAVSPMAVDVCSGVEAEPGRKDLSMMKAFMAEVQGVHR